MKFSIVSPSFNQVDFLDRAIESVAFQTWADKEHIVLDPGSSDGSRERLEALARLHPHMRLIFEPDRGQADAISKGFALATGDILAWINTDDAYSDPDVFAAVAEAFAADPQADLIYGRGTRLDADGSPIREAYINRNISGPESLKTSLGVFQPSVFFRREVFERVGGLSDDYNLQLDYEYWIRMLQAGVRFRFLDRRLAVAAVHADAKSTRDRLNQLSECLSMIDERYGEAPDEWVRRLARFYATRRDEKVSKDDRLSADEEALSGLIHAAVSKTLAQEPAPVPPRVIITSFDSKYFRQGLNLIAGLHRTSFLSFDQIIVYSLDLTPGERELLDALAKVRVIDYPADAPADFPDFYQPSGRAYKVAAIAGVGLDLPADSLVLWMDAGLTALVDIDEVFSKIEADHFFIADHDDSASWPFFNVHFMHRDAVRAIQPTVEELLAPHLCSCIVGHRRGGRHQRIIDEALSIGADRGAVMWPKVIDRNDRHKDAHADANRAWRLDVLADPARLQAVTIDDLYERFPYYGHRTQSIYSVLVKRHGAEVSSAKLYRRSNASSSKAAQANWLKGAHAVDDGASRTALEAVEPQTRLYHHRGVYTDLSGLIFERAAEPALVVGNGPSLRGLDFELLRGKAWLGMNAAYRFWEETGVYPYVYACFDTVVQESHQSEIRALIEGRAHNGIRWFFLRRSFLEFWPEAGALGCVFFLEDLQRDVEWFDRDKITTGSYSLYVMAFLGFTEVYILGVDLNYVEQIDEAKVEGRELVIAEAVTSNPNYFFDGYQKPGDRYNPPNRHAGMHLRSWNATVEALAGYPISIFNANPDSAVRCYPFVGRDRAVKALDSKHLVALRVADRARAHHERRRYFRQRLIDRLLLQERPVVDHEPLDEPKLERLASWLRPWRRTARTLAPAPTVKPTEPPHHARSAHAEIEESAIVARLLAERRGREHFMLDIGAFDGSSAAHFERLGWRIHCFEPEPENRAKLTQRFGSHPDITIDARAVGETVSASQTFYTSPESPGIGALHPFRESHTPLSGVPVTTIDQALAARGQDRVDFLKVDVEGYDLAVLRGAPWDTVRPDVVMAEFEDAKTARLGHGYRDICEFLTTRGYAVYVSEWHPIIRYGVPHDWRELRKYPCQLADADAWGNILAFTEDPGFDALDRLFQANVRFRKADTGSAATPVPTQGATATKLANTPHPSPEPRPEQPSRKPPVSILTLTALKDRHRGERCFIMGNGPSLNDLDLSLLEGETVLACNAVHLLFDRIRWRPRYYACVDTRVMQDRGAEIARMLEAEPGMTGFFPRELAIHDGTGRMLDTRSIIGDPPNAVFFNEVWNDDGASLEGMFSSDAARRMVMPYTVAITLMQLAAHMGFSEMILIGCDTRYVIPSSVKQEGPRLATGDGLFLTSSQDDDPNHFDPRYFGKGRAWHNPQVAKMIEHHGFAKAALDALGVRVVNATPGGDLEVYPRADFASFFARAEPDRPPVATTRPPSPGTRPGGLVIIQAGPEARSAAGDVQDHQAVMAISNGADIGEDLAPSYIVGLGAATPAAMSGFRRAARPDSPVRRLMLSSETMRALDQPEKGLDAELLKPILWPDLAGGDIPPAALALLWAEFLGFGRVSLVGVEAALGANAPPGAEGVFRSTVKRLRESGIDVRVG